MYLEGTLNIIGFADLGKRGIPWTRQHVRRQEHRGKFPKRVQLGDNTVGWVEQEIDEWIANRLAERAGEPPHPSASEENLERAAPSPRPRRGQPSPAAR
jgi:prophage regulatory protein